MEKVCRGPARLAAFLLGVTLIFVPAVWAESFVRGNANGDSKIDIADPVTILHHLFIGMNPIACDKAADVDDNGILEITDAVYLLDYLFLGGPQPLPPYPTAGSDPTTDTLTCGAGAFTSIAATPSPLHLNGMGTTAQLLVTGSSAGGTVDLTAGSTGTTYISGNQKVVLVYRDGKVEGVAAGTTTVMVHSAGLQATVPVTIGSAGASSSYRILAVNDLGMHCIDREFSIYSILPPYNVVHAQAVHMSASGAPTLLDGSSIVVRYSPVVDAKGQINSHSIGKSSFWDFAQAAYGAVLQPGQGLMGLYMPDDAPEAGPQTIPYSPAKGYFSADGIPAIDKDDVGGTLTYPLLRVSAFDKTTGAFLTSTDVVVPVSSETDCQNCHLTGGIAAHLSSVEWATDADPEIQAKKNVLILHDRKNGTDLAFHSPVLCAGCHYSPALDLGGVGPQGPQIGHATFSSSMHAYHGTRLDGQGQRVFPEDGNADATCYQCHPGAKTRCLRGAMANAGLECLNCHGGMLAVGGINNLAPGGSLDGQNDGGQRRPWKDLPRCQSCHTGTATSHLSGADYKLAADGIRLTQAYKTGDAAASAILATNKTFAENLNTLYRFSTGHSGMLCESCHGSTHAEWPNGDPAANDNVETTKAQGHTGKIIECKTCHAPGSLSLTMNGPHGMHNVGDNAWVSEGSHKLFYESNPSQCETCHGADLLGTALSKTAAARSFVVEDQSVSIAKGTKIGCNLCHGMPGL